MDETLARGRAAFERQAWAEAHAALVEADRASPLGAEDLDRLATVAYLVGLDDDSLEARTRAFQSYLERGDTLRAAGCAVYRLFGLLERRNRHAEIGGWLARAQRLLDDCPAECAERGFLLCLLAQRKGSEGDADGSREGFAQAAAIGDRLRHSDLIALARHGEGRALLKLERTAEGLARLDEVMASITAGEVDPLVTGIVYCSAISACHEIFDLRRAQEWTAAMTGWCAAHPDMVPFRGTCLIRRSELLQLHGAWHDAAEEARRACERMLAADDAPDAGAAFYQRAELFRLSGDFSRAEEAYRLASRAGRRPQPGLALLRLAQGDAAAAAIAIRSALHETRAPRMRAQVLHAAVEILLAAADLAAAQSAAGELQELARRADALVLRAASAHADGAVALAEGHAHLALDRLREAWDVWRELDAPFEVARVRTLLASAYAALGDGEGARMELEAALESFEHLGARPDAERVAALRSRHGVPPSGGLTGREVEVLRQIASGKTNRAIAADLAISEKTVARHVSNIFTKLDLSSRSAATAYAYEHKLI
jgi:DNA-binding NarL/FixJ family response regulator